MDLIIRIILFSFLFCRVSPEPDNKPLPFSLHQVINHIDITINNLKETTGLVRIGIFTSETGYPDKPAFNYSLAKDTLKNGRLRLVIPVDKPCEISISVLDDENLNGEMDYKFGIMPKEGFGFSNNPKVNSRKAPSFDKTSFLFTGGERKIDINMVYM
jgi:uncharacterized protein (DUF2141 family)